MLIRRCFPPVTLLRHLSVSRRPSHLRRHGRCAGASAVVAGIEVLEERRLLSAAGPQTLDADGEHSVARLWNDELLDAIRRDTPRPTVHARNLFHVSIAMYDAWAVYDPRAEPYLHREFVIPRHDPAAQQEAISFAAYRVLEHRFASSPGASVSLAAFDALMEDLGYDPSFTSTVGRSPAAVGNRVAQTIIGYGTLDGANEASNYADTSGYTPVNSPMNPHESGTGLGDPNRWQPLEINGRTQVFLTPHWGDVTPFAMERHAATDVYFDPGAPPQLGGPGDAEFKEAILRVIAFSSVLDPTQDILVDRSPGVFGDNPLGTNDGGGHALNPATGQPYESNVVNLGDWGRVLAEFWADGPNSETPPGHWNTIANYVSDEMDELGLRKRIGGRGPAVDELEWDVKLYFTLNGAVHDAAIAAWDVKEQYDYVRPISMIRHMGELGQSSDPDAPSFHEHGLPLAPGLVEVITVESSAPGERHAHLAEADGSHVGEIAIFAWAGHPDDPDGVGGVEWIRPEDWLPYQAETFVTPPFAGFVSGHSTFSRASAEVLTSFTGSEFFPGGLGTFVADTGTYLKFEGGPSERIELQWATYYDAADEAGLSRLYGGIHVDADDFDGRMIGSQVGTAAWRAAAQYFSPRGNDDRGRGRDDDDGRGHGRGHGRGGDGGGTRGRFRPAFDELRQLIDLAASRQDRDDGDRRGGNHDEDGHSERSRDEDSSPSRRRGRGLAEIEYDLDLSFSTLGRSWGLSD